MTISNSPKESFLPGEEWLYYKIYIGKTSSNTFIVNVLQTLCEKWIKNHLISMWFYIRYYDDNYHLRFRVKLIDHNNILKVMSDFNEKIKSFLDNYTIWKIEIGTYNREIDRYGTVTMLDSEKIFFINSVLCCNMLALKNSESRLYCNSFFIVIELLTELSKLGFDKSNFINYMRTELNNFHNVGSDTRQKINRKYAIITLTTLEKQTEYKRPIALDGLIKEYINSVVISYKIIRSRPGGKVIDFIASHIHMFINRVFCDKQPHYEMIIYNMLYKYNKANKQL